MKYVLAIDQGTTSSRAVLFDAEMHIAAISQQEFPQYFPKSGWVEHDPEKIWRSVIETCQSAMQKIGATASDIVSIGITNQRETVVAWDAGTGKVIHNAIVWQDRRTAEMCRMLRADGLEDIIGKKTGLLLDPYFSATKIRWILDNVPSAEVLAKDGQLRIGTIDCFLVWRLTGGKVFATDATNAARTMLYDITKNCWDAEICTIMRVSNEMLPEVKDCADEFGETASEHFGGAIAIRGIAGDQQAATIGQACFQPGMLKSTYGTGCFALLNTGSELVSSQNRLLGTIAYRLNGETTYALEGSIFIAGAAVQWLRDGLKIVENASDTQKQAELADPEQQMYLVPAFTGLGAPYWDAECRGAVFGLTRNSGPNEFARAALECVGYQTRDLLEAMRADWKDDGENILRVDGGMSDNNWAMQFLSDILGVPVDRPHIHETTAVGVAWLAGMKSGFYPSQIEFSQKWESEKRFVPTMPKSNRENKYRGWQDAVRRTLTN